MRNLLILLALLTIVSCGSKKKITSVSKSYDLSIDKSTKVTEQRSDIKRTDTSKTKTKVAESLNEQTIERYIFSDDGRLKEYTKETNKKQDKQTDTDENKGVSVDSVGQIKESSVSDIKNKNVAYQKDVDLDRKGQNLIYWGIGIGIIIIFLFFSIRVFLRR